MGKKSTTNVPAADPAIGAAAMKQAQLGEDWLKIAQEQFGVANERQKGLDALSSEVTGQQLGAARQAQQWASQDRDRYTSTFVPLQNQFIDRANTWDSVGRQNQVASEARADVLGAAAQADATRARQQAAMGVDPRSGRYAGIERGADLATGLAAAGAQNTARGQVRKEAVAMQADAVNLGNGLAVNPGQALGLGVQAGSAAVGTATNANTQARANAGVLQSGYGTAMGGYGSQAGILQGQQNYNLNAWSTQNQASRQQSQDLWGGVGQLSGLAGMALMSSSKEVKEDKRPVDGALDAVRSMPVEEWSYKEGEGDGGRHIGPYAEDFQKATGRGNGKQISIIDAIGVNMKATQELAEKVDELSSIMPRRRAAPQRSAA